MSNSLGIAKKFDLNTAKGVVMITVVIIIVILLIVFGKQIGTFISGIGDSINNLFGFSKPKAVTDAEQAGIDANTGTGVDPNGPWSSNLYNANPDVSNLDYGTLLDMASKITGSVDPYLPNSIDPPVGAEMLAQFKICQSKVDVSNLVLVFQQKYSGDLYDYVSHNLSNNTNDNKLILQQVLTYVNNLPTT